VLGIEGEGWGGGEGGCLVYCTKTVCC
jgi:hypothetical protein